MISMFVSPSDAAIYLQADATNTLVCTLSALQVEVHFKGSNWNLLLRCSLYTPQCKLELQDGQ